MEKRYIRRIDSLLPEALQDAPAAAAVNRRPAKMCWYCAKQVCHLVCILCFVWGSKRSAGELLAGRSFFCPKQSMEGDLKC